MAKQTDQELPDQELPDQELADQELPDQESAEVDLAPLVLGSCSVDPGERCDTELTLSESYSGLPIVMPISVWRSRVEGPTVFITAAVHGDELNGTGIVRELLREPPFRLTSGSLILVPVVNVFGLERHQRYLPDRRDLNRSFPGDTTGSLARRFARGVFDAFVSQCDFGIDLHTAAVRRTNFPNVRADLSHPDVKRIAMAFGSEIVINGKGPKGSLRRAATDSGCPTIILEAGEVWKIEPSVVEFGIRGIRNVLIELGMVAGEKVAPPYQLSVRRTKWVRAEVGGMISFHVSLGDVVKKGEPLASQSNLLGREVSRLDAPASGMIIGITTMPVVKPGDPVCHIAIPRGSIDKIRSARQAAPDESIHERLRDDLATSVTVVEPSDLQG